MKANMRELVRSFRRVAPQLLVATALLCSGLSGCENPKQDEFRSNGGISPDPEGIMRGSIVYVGPRPTCEYEKNNATRVIGRVILTLFEYDNPPPPEGRATSALNLLSVSGSKLFTLSDCLPEGEATDPTEKVTRSVRFEWPTIPLDAKKSIDYQVRGFYDYDEDMNPFFSVKRLPTAGDIAGAAVNDISDASKGLMRITMLSRAKAKNGYVRDGVTVALGSYIWTELPAFKLQPQRRKLSAQSPIKVEIDFVALAPDVPKTVRGIFNLTCGSASPTADCGLSLQSLRESEVAKTFDEAGLQLDFDPASYAFFVEQVDIRTIKPGEPDVAIPDGLADPHPLLGSSLGVRWLTPIVLFLRRAASRAETLLEVQAGIPGVTLVGSVLPDETVLADQLTQTQRTFVNSLNIAVPPLAVVDLVPGNSACRVPYAAPGNITNTFEDRVAQCADLPTGRYAVNVLHGLRGGERSPEADPAVSANGVRVDDASYAGQAWTVPNELAEPVQVGEENVLSDQGADGMFLVHDPEPEKTGDCTVAADPRMMLVRPIVYRRLCEEGESPVFENPTATGNTVGIDNLGCLAPTCCDAVAHLCGLELCPVEQVDGVNIRKSPSKIVGKAENGLGIPDCVPFSVPDLCCTGR